ncbi:MAG: hypothetical protein KDA88_12620 [Planctomycetaceae bacterium]|nr:hypothetical protein [Planctomycetaceae bacterium]MCB9950197.1 hypothetical protein [Planctomycetaceae bacterium]
MSNDRALNTNYSLKQVGEFGVDGDSIRISDMSMFFDEFIEMELPSGRYIVTQVSTVAGKFMGYAVCGDLHSRPTRSLGQISIPFGQLGVFNTEIARNFLNAIDSVDYDSQYLATLVEPCEIVVDNHQIAFCLRCSGGLVTVYELMTAAHVSGVMLRYVLE